MLKNRMTVEKHATRPDQNVSVVRKTDWNVGDTMIRDTAILGQQKEDPDYTLHWPLRWRRRLVYYPWPPVIPRSNAILNCDFETTVGALPSGLPDVPELHSPLTSRLKSTARLDTNRLTLTPYLSQPSMRSPNTIEIIELTAPPPEIPEVPWTQSIVSPTAPGDQLADQASTSASYKSQSLAIVRAPAGLTSGQASLFEALFSLAQPNSIAPPAFEPLPNSTQYLSSSPSSSSQSPWTSPDVEDDASDTSEDDDQDNARQIWCSSPVMDSSIPTNSLPYVLQSYANWLNYTMFEPLNLVYPTKECVVWKFGSSQESRTKIILIANAMSMLRRTRNPRGVSLVSMLASQVYETICIFKSKSRITPASEQQYAQAALDHIVEIIGVQLYSSPLSSVIRLLEDTAPVFRAACPDPPTQLVNLPDLLLGPWVHLRYFAVTDVTLSITTGRPMFFRYDIEFSLELCERMVQRKVNFGLTWMHGMPDQLVVLFAWMNSLREEAQIGTPIRTEVITRIEQDIKRLKIVPSKAADPMLKVGRFVVQECWRQAAYIYLYMALCGAHAQDTRVKKQTKAFMRLVNGTAPGRNPDAFLVIPAVVAGVAATKLSDRETLRARLSALPECRPGTCRHDNLRILEDLWIRTADEGRPPVWEDLRVSCLRIVGM
ncbi:hypothetical protein RHS04_06601 [Rhizoctonia solani]|uniref:Fungal-specific transcription factor domain protein n=1 Tax=Rhizoctonia solani TaxID=456999 RepID=A0A8H7LFU5_9AGAM|nr:hypothetical protein RHS04_06601 [Rhizoctonia solani]